MCEVLAVRTAYRCRAYPSPEQAAVFSRTFGCVRLVWNKTLAERHTAYHERGEKTSSMVVISRDPDGRWFVTFAVDTDDPEPLAEARHAIGVDLGVKDFAVTSDGENMVKNRRLAKAISDAGWGEFRRQLEYKAERAGRTLIVIDRWYPSSKTCSACGHLLATLSLSTRHWTCPNCRTRRDVNAAKNILAAGRAVARENPGDACGADVRRQGSSLPRSAVKQETHAVRRPA
jgi:transposase